MSHELEEERARALAARVAGRLARGTAAATTAAGSASSADENAGGLGRELAALRAGLSEIKQRLAHLESHIVGEAECKHENDANGWLTPLVAAGTHRRTASNAEPADASSPLRWTSSTYIPVVPPSEQRFDINDAVSELADHFEQGKTCTLEPGGKPCDHCSMCSTRGF